mmetsp:Transcript_18826/g.52324  ORF Transcript_18826/g.52324 Transcript_18826/m.52324 type:complete len:381 (+) Transcript_18826:112-1254(+)
MSSSRCSRQQAEGVPQDLLEQLCSNLPYYAGNGLHVQDSIISIAFCLAPSSNVSLVQGTRVRSSEFGTIGTELVGVVAEETSVRVLSVLGVVNVLRIDGRTRSVIMRAVVVGPTQPDGGSLLARRNQRRDVVVREWHGQGGVERSADERVFLGWRVLRWDCALQCGHGGRKKGDDLLRSELGVEVTSCAGVFERLAAQLIGSRVVAGRVSHLVVAVGTRAEIEDELDGGTIVDDGALGKEVRDVRQGSVVDCQRRELGLYGKRGQPSDVGRTGRVPGIQRGRASGDGHPARGRPAGVHLGCQVGNRGRDGVDACRLGLIECGDGGGRRGMQLRCRRNLEGCGSGRHEGIAEAAACESHEGGNGQLHRLGCSIVAVAMCCL